MDDMKQWYLSKTVWGALIAIVASVARPMGLDLDIGLQAEMADSLVSLAGALGGLVAVYGRVTAETRLG
jgi:hypothetical protein